MSIIKNFSVGNGDCFYIKHNSSNFTIIDCYNSGDEKFNSIINEITQEKKEKDIVRFISTHPDEDHIKGLEALFEKINIPNFYCVENRASKSDPSSDFKYYRSLRDGASAFYIYKGCIRCWLNSDDGVKKYGCSGLHVLWPDRKNREFQNALYVAANGGDANNISPILQYSLEGGVTALWFGDMENDFLNKVHEQIEWPRRTDILFAPHHGRDSGKIPEPILRKINPGLIIIGEADSTYLNYYNGWNTITQNSAGDMIFECETGEMHIFVSNQDYQYHYDNLYTTYVDSRSGYKYIGTLKTGE